MHFTGMLQNMVAETAGFMRVFCIPMKCPSIYQISSPWRRCLHPEEDHLHDHPSHHDHPQNGTSQIIIEPPSSRRFQNIRLPEVDALLSHVQDLRSICSFRIYEIEVKDSPPKQNCQVNAETSQLHLVAIAFIYIATHSKTIKNRKFLLVFGVFTT